MYVCLLKNEIFCTCTFHLTRSQTAIFFLKFIYAAMRNWAHANLSFRKKKTLCDIKEGKLLEKKKRIRPPLDLLMVKILRMRCLFIINIKGYSETKKVVLNLYRIFSAS